MPHGFLRTAAAVPVPRVADPQANAERTLDLLREAEVRAVALAVFPECGLTGYTCGDLFHQAALIAAAEAALGTLLAARCYSGIAVVGLPVPLDGRLFNVAAIFQGGVLLGVVPKSYLPNYKEFYDARYFAPARTAVSARITLAGQTVPFGTDLLFESATLRNFVLGVEICEDLWMPVPPSSLLAIHGATVLANLSASNETIGKAAYRRQLVVGQSGRCIAGYVYAGSGPGESTTDLVFGGHALIAENGSLLQESARFRREAHLTVADIDLDRLEHDRIVTNGFRDATELVRPMRRVAVDLVTPVAAFPTATLERHIDPLPFVPDDPATRDDRCAEIFHTQVAGLAKRLEHVGTTSCATDQRSFSSCSPKVAIGVSGGLDSTLALVVLVKTADLLGLPRTAIHALTMPGFGTTARTKANATTLMRTLGVTAREIDIRQACLDEMLALGHAPFGLALKNETVESLTAKLRDLPAHNRSDLTFENVQARARTSRLMNTGFTIGTGDLSELALGWCTYNADHMSMYNPNASVPKTLVRDLVRWVANAEFGGEIRATLLDVVVTAISPELLPTSRDGTIAQLTESVVGPYELHDFFLYHTLRWGCPPAKILFLAAHAKFAGDYSAADIRKWLAVFVRRFFANQFKRSCLPDGPKVGSVSVSPRGDWRMPSDAAATAWLASVEAG